ncbi:MAG: IPT/TIG domain-containing protein [Acidobacteria bacterium]|nr:IPT/TIG domain-containing protein [Acidobacteriota bacterium]
MAQKLEKVKPGDLITSAFMNALLTQLESLEDRVAALEGSTQPDQTVKITGFEFKTNPLRVGHQLTVKGQNFSVPSELNNVTIGGVKVTDFALSGGENQLGFVIPELTGLSESGSSVVVEVSNAKGKDSDTLNVSPKVVVPHGNIQVLYKIPPVVVGSLNIESAKSYIFTFDVKAIASQQGNYTLTPSVTGAPSWTAELLEDNGDTVRASNVITLPANPTTGEIRSIRVRLKIPAAQANGTAGTLRLTVTENTPGTGVTPGNAQFIVTVGQPPPTPDNRVRIMLESAQNGAVIGTGENTNKIMFKRGQVGIVGLSLEFSVGGNFNVSTAVKNPTGWTVGETDSTVFVMGKPTQGQTSKQTILAEFTAGQTAAETEMYVLIKGWVEGTQDPINIRYAQTIGVVA